MHRLDSTQCKHSKTHHVEEARVKGLGVARRAGLAIDSSNHAAALGIAIGGGGCGARVQVRIAAVRVNAQVGVDTEPKAGATLRNVAAEAGPRAQGAGGGAARCRISARGWHRHGRAELDARFLSGGIHLGVGKGWLYDGRLGFQAK